MKMKKRSAKLPNVRWQSKMTRTTMTANVLPQRSHQKPSHSARHSLGPQWPNCQKMLHPPPLAKH
jgi:hypothetical protein